jgi:hypothetical protein
MSLTHGETFVIPNIRISTMMCVRERERKGEVKIIYAQ